MVGCVGQGRGGRAPLPGWPSTRTTRAGPATTTNSRENAGARPAEEKERMYETSILVIERSGFRVEGSGFRVQGAGFRVQGSGSRVQGSGFRVQPVPGNREVRERREARGCFDGGCVENALLSGLGITLGFGFRVSGQFD